MRQAWTLASWLAVVPAVVAQTPPVSLTPAGQAQPAAPALDPAKNPLDAHLLQWEQKMKAVAALQADLVRYETDALTKQTRVMQGQAKIRRPDQAALYLKSTSDPNIYEQYIFTGTYLYEYRPQNKIVRIHEVAGRAGVEDNFLNFLFGMKAEDAKRRYNLTLRGEDANYVYIFVEPKLRSDQQDFTKARLALLKATYLPRQFEFETNNNDVVKWDIPRLDPAAKVTPADFTPPQPPAGWKVEKMPRQPAPGGPTPGTPAGAPPQPSKVRPAGG